MAECGGAALIVDYGEEEGVQVVQEDNVVNAEKNNAGKENVSRKIEEKRMERDTLRAFRHHRQVHPLVSVTAQCSIIFGDHRIQDLPGTADITADVDFSYIRSQV